MPKEKRAKSVTSEIRCKASPYLPNSSCKKSASPEDIREWDEVRCPICMEHPHNAVLLLCSSHDKGCRPFMCDTSYRHSNCLDQYRKVVSGSKTEGSDGSEQQETLACPLCRGLVTGWTVLDSARSYMNAKTRSCSKESCGFTGVYGELRKHARKEHPSVRPAEADPERQQDWRRMEQQRDIADLFSMLQSAVTGDEVDISIDEEHEELPGSAVVLPSMTVLVVVHVHRLGEAGRSTLHGSLSPRSYTRGGGRTRSLLFLRGGFGDGTSLDRMSIDEPNTSNQVVDGPEEVNEVEEEEEEAGPRRQGRRTPVVTVSDDEDDDVL